jgi:hypothetical protein
MSTLAVVEEILRETAVPMSVREIVERAGARLPSKSKTPDTVVARDLSMDIKKKGEASLFIRTSPGRYTLRTLVAGATPVADTTDSPLAMGSGARPVSPSAPAAAPQPMSALGARKPAAAAPQTQGRARTDSDVGGGFAG